MAGAAEDNGEPIELDVVLGANFNPPNNEDPTVLVVLVVVAVESFMPKNALCDGALVVAAMLVVVV